MVISAISAGELWTWVAGAGASEKSKNSVSDFLELIEVGEVDLTVALRFGKIRGQMLDAGTPCPDMDTLIAAMALVGNLTLATHNLADFQSRVLADELNRDSKPFPPG